MKPYQKLLAKILPFIFTAVLFSCTNQKDIDVSGINITTTIHRIDQQLLSCRNINDIRDLLAKNKDFTNNFYGNGTNTEEIAKGLWALVSNQEFQNFYQKNKHVFGDGSGLKAEFEAAFKHIKYYYPSFKAPIIYTTVSGLSNDLYVSDSVIIISLDSFFGEKAQFRPQQPNYILKRYQKQYIVPIVVQYLSGKFNVSNSQDATLLADMLYYGKALEFTKSVMPNTPDSLITGYSEKQLSETYDAQDLVWAHFIDKKLLFETKPPIKDRYMGERPTTNEIGSACPGAIGHWLGWRIVQRYRTENQEKTLQDLMKNTNAQEILSKSKYRGLKDEE